ncbi:unnamed protein product [Linum trigynum]|uniref:Uncharacterized protein n=1 Tax=Linum trigynum TaxID=586398 RepID=A0AAV2EMU7_9ROSI
MNDFMSNVHGVGAERTCLFAFDLNVHTQATTMWELKRRRMVMIFSWAMTPSFSTWRSFSTKCCQKTTKGQTTSTWRTTTIASRTQYFEDVGDDTKNVVDTNNLGRVE